MARSTLRVAAAQYPVTPLQDWSTFAGKLEQWIAEAAGQGAQLLLFPEYGAMELVTLLAPDQRGDLQRQILGLQSLLPDYLALYTELARRYQVTVVAATLPVQLATGRFVNRAHLFLPEGNHHHQDKQIMTRFENETWGIQAGAGLRVIDTPHARVGLLICYDAEFPLLARALCEQGAQILLVPSCTDRLAGYHRVRIGAQARALENQVFTVQSCTVGELPESHTIDSNVGAAGFFAPPDIGFPDNGIIAEGELNQPQWVYADLELARSERVRSRGQVLNWRDWQRQPRS